MTLVYCFGGAEIESQGSSTVVNHPSWLRNPDDEFTSPAFEQEGFVSNEGDKATSL